MKYLEKQIPMKDGRRAILRNAAAEDSAALVAYMKSIYAETRFLLREPEEAAITLEQEQQYIQAQLDSRRDLLLIATVEGKHAGNGSLSSLGPWKRYRHRCEISIALYQTYCGLGLGRQMCLELLKQARECGYEQAELEVMAGNETAIALYESMGFQRYGTRKRAMKYSDGTYEDAYLMMIQL